MLAKYEDIDKLIDHETKNCSTKDNSYVKENERLKQQKKNLEDELKNMKKSLLEAQNENKNSIGIIESKQKVTTSLKKKLSEKESGTTNSADVAKLIAWTDDYINDYQVKLKMPSREASEESILNLELPRIEIEVNVLT